MENKKLNILGTEYTIVFKPMTDEETVVDWFAIQGIKIYKAWEIANAI